MALTNAQLATLNADIKANVKTVQIGAEQVAIKDVPNTADNAFAIADWYNSLTAAFQVYKNNIPPQEIFDKIDWAKLTPTDAPDGTQAWANRSLACQGKQFNIQIILQGQTAIDATKSNVRAGLQDALTNVPSGTSGATVSAGWVPVRDSLYTLAKNGEKLFATGTGSTANPATRTVYGNITPQDVRDARDLG